MTTSHSGDLRVLHVDTGATWRGGQAQALNLCRGLRREGVEQCLVAQPDAPLRAKAEQAGVEVVPLRMRAEWDLWAARGLRSIIERRGPALVHAHDAHAHALAWRALKTRRDVALVISRRVDFKISRNPLSRRKYLDPRVRYLAISHGVRDVLLRGGVAPERILVVPSGVDPSRFTFAIPRDRLRAEFAIAPGVPVIGTIGALADHKGHRYLIEAAPRILEKRPDARFFIVGSGELRDDLERRIRRLGLEKSFVLTGFREDVEVFLSGFDVYALSSHLEGLCTSLIDAMLFRLPIVATRTGGVPDLIRDGETGLLVEPRDPDALAQAILRLAAAADTGRRLGEAARAHALANFTIENLVRKTLEAYRAILEDASGRNPDLPARA